MGIKFKRAVIEFTFYCSDMYPESYITGQLVGMIRATHSCIRGKLAMCKIVNSNDGNVHVQADLTYNEYRQIARVLYTTYPLDWDRNVVRFI